MNLTPAQAWDAYQAIVTETGAHCAHEIDDPSDRKRLTTAWTTYCRAFVAAAGKP